MKMSPFKKILPLFRPPLALVAACSGLTGYLAASGRDLHYAAVVFGGTLLLAAGSSALNQCQERETDALMERTRSRPLPSLMITNGQALVVSLLLIAAGLLVLLLSGIMPLLLGGLALAWYHCLYTPLKRRSALAAVPGALVGMLPPAMGWTAAGGSLAEPGLWALLFLFFLWQVPHFWLQVLHHGKEYEQAGLPSLSSLLSKEQLGRIIFIWVCSVAASGLLLPLYGTLSPRFFAFLLLPAGAILVARMLPLLFAGAADRSLSALRSVNIYILIVMALLSFEGLLLPLK